VIVLPAALFHIFDSIPTRRASDGSREALVDELLVGDVSDLNVPFRAEK
jgi:hypothetical protein